jgi:hypothetical protein
LFIAVRIFTSAPFAICHQGTASETLAEDFSCCIKTALIFTTTIQDETLIFQACHNILNLITYYMNRYELMIDSIKPTE